MDVPAIELRDVHKAFDDLHVLRGIDLVVPSGTTTVIMGESGSGKTILLKVMIGLVKPDQGDVLIDGESIVRMSEHELEHVREKFGMVFQGSALFSSLTVYENVALPLREHFRKLPEREVAQRVHAKLELFGLGGNDDLLPEDLSGGMRKRLALARATVLEPRIMLYDEPTTGLDPIMAESVAQSIIRAREALGVTTVAICQDLAIAFEMADQVAFLHEGRIAAHGTPAEVRTSHDPEVFRFVHLWEESVAAVR